MKTGSCYVSVFLLMLLILAAFTMGCVTTENSPAGSLQKPATVVEGTIKSAGDLVLTQEDFGRDYKVHSRIDNPDVLVNLTPHFPADWNQSKRDEYNTLLQKALEDTEIYLKHGLVDSSTVFWTRTDSGGNNTGFGTTEVYVFTNATGAQWFFEKQKIDRCEISTDCFRSMQGLGDIALKWTGNGSVSARYIVRVDNAVVTSSADEQAEALVAAEKIVAKAGTGSSGQITTPVSTVKTVLPTPVQPIAISTVDRGNCSPVTITQTDGTPVTLPCIPKRIIVTNSDAAEMLIAIGAGDRIVGITDSTKNVSYIMDKIPDAVSIGTWQVPNVERILELHPDVVISYSSSRPKNLDRILASNITVIYLDCYRLNSIPSDVRALGVLTGKTSVAEDYARMVENATSLVRQRVSSVPSGQYPKTYFESYSDYMAASNGSGADEMLKIAGGKNIAGDMLSSSIQVSPEWVISQNPDIVIKVVSSSETRPYSEIVRVLKDRNGWEGMPAVQDNRVYAFSGNIQYGPKAYIGLLYTAKILHPDLFGDIFPSELLHDYARKYISGADNGISVYPEPG